MNDYSTKSPRVVSATLTPQSVAVNAKYKLAVTIDEVTVILYPEIYCAGEIYAGED